MRMALSFFLMLNNNSFENILSLLLMCVFNGRLVVRTIFVTMFTKSPNVFLLFRVNPHPEND